MFDYSLHWASCHSDEISLGHSWQMCICSCVLFYFLHIVEPWTRWSSARLVSSLPPTMRHHRKARIPISRHYPVPTWTAKKTNEWVLISWSKEGTVRHRQSKEASILWSHHEETRELPGERDNARNNARCTKARKASLGLDGQHQDMDRTLSGRVSQNDRGQG